jgi:hypothetical protein
MEDTNWLITCFVHNVLAELPNASETIGRTLTREKPPWRAIRSSSKGMSFAEAQARFGTEGPDLSRSPLSVNDKSA